MAFGRHTLLQPDDCLYALQPSIAYLTRSSQHRYLQCHRISRLRDVEDDKTDKRKFEPNLLGHFPTDIAHVCTERGKLYLLVAIDRTTKFGFVQLHEQSARQVAGDFMQALITAVPY